MSEGSAVLNGRPGVSPAKQVIRLRIRRGAEVYRTGWTYVHSSAAGSDIISIIGAIAEGAR